MPKVTIDTIASGFGSTTLLNSNFTALQTAIENTLSRDGTSPNTMDSNIDMNSNRLINLTAPTNNADGATKLYVDDLVANATGLTNTELTSIRLWEYDDTITMADPGTGLFRLNHATPASATAIAISASSADAGNPDLSDWIDSWDASSNTVKGQLILTDPTAPVNTIIFYITGSVTDNTTWLQFTITNVEQAGSLQDGVNYTVAFTRAGDVGSAQVADGDKGDITVSGSGLVWTIDAGTVDPAMLADADFGDFTVSSGVATLDSGTVDTAELAAGAVTTTEIDSGTLVTEADGISSNDNDTTLPTSAAVKDYVDNNVGGGTTLGTPVASTSGTEIDFAIPAGTNRITIAFDEVSTNGSSQIMIQLGDSGGFETTGYRSTASFSTVSGSSSSGFIVEVSTGLGTSIVRSGALTFTRYDDYSWVLNGAINNYSNAYTSSSAGRKVLTAELEDIRITTVGGSNTFDAGSINVIYE